jgi:hypothetical protein
LSKAPREDRLCYSLFHTLSANSQRENLVFLLYSQEKKRFEYTVYLLSENDILVEAQTYGISIEKIDYSRLAYTQHKSVVDNSVQVRQAL